MMEMDFKTEFNLTEYKALKKEEANRIRARDHMIYLTLIALGSVFGFALQANEYRIAFLILPFFCIIMGWTYFVNDRRVSKIVSYIKYGIAENLTNWEDYKADSARLWRKRVQLIIDIILLIGVYLISIGEYIRIEGLVNKFHLLVILFEAVLLFILSVSFIINWKR